VKEASFDNYEKKKIVGRFEEMLKLFGEWII
jgi:hypothetical protein